MTTAVKTPPTEEVETEVASGDKKLTLFGNQDGPEGFVNYGLEPPGRHLLMQVAGGGLRSGKTFAGAARDAIYMTKYPGSRGMIVGLTERNISAGYLDDLFTVFELVGMREGVHWEQNKQMGEIRIIPYGSTLFIRTAENIDVSVGAGLSFLHIDEPDTMPATVATKLIPRLSHKKCPHQVVITGTPGPPDHWLRRYTDPINYALEYPDIPVKPMPHWEIREYIFTTEEATEYPELSGITPQHLEALQAMYGGKDTPMARRNLCGEYVTLEGVAYPTWDACFHMKPIEQWTGRIKFKVAGVDFGGGNAPTAVLIYSTDETGKYRYIIDEWESEKGKVCSEDTLIMRLKMLHEKHGLDMIAPDSADPRWVHALRVGLAGTGIRIYEPKKDRTFGHTACLATLTSKVDGNQCLCVDPKCVMFKREIESYVDGGPKNQADHLMDCWRYAELTMIRYYGMNVPTAIMRHYQFRVGNAA